MKRLRGNAMDFTNGGLIRDLEKVEKSSDASLTAKRHIRWCCGAQTFFDVASLDFGQLLEQAPLPFVSILSVRESVLF
jgi:hypothetical protein